MEYRAAVHHAALVLDLASKSKKYMRELFEPPDVRETAGKREPYAYRCFSQNTNFGTSIDRPRVS